MSEEIVIELVAKEKTYASKDLSVQLEIGTSTLRKWSSLLEQYGCTFRRDTRGRREYLQVDFIALRKMKELIYESTMSLEEAAAAIAYNMQRKQWSQHHSLPVTSSLTHQPQHYPAQHYQVLEQKVDLLAHHVEKQDAFNLALLERLDKQEKFISINLKERDRRLTKAMNDILEAKSAIAVIKDSHQKKSLWHRLFKIT